MFWIFSSNLINLKSYRIHCVLYKAQNLLQSLFCKKDIHHPYDIWTLTFTFVIPLTPPGTWPGKYLLSLLFLMMSAGRSYLTAILSRLYLLWLSREIIPDVVEDWFVEVVSMVGLMMREGLLIVEPVIVVVTSVRWEKTANLVSGESVEPIMMSQGNDSVWDRNQEE